MKRSKLHVDAEAEREAAEAAAWYEERETGLGAAFVRAAGGFVPSP